MFPKLALTALSLAAMALGQQIGTNQAETHPKLTWQTCTGTGNCQTNSNGAVVLDANWRWTHNVGGFTNCYTGNTWDNTLCPDGQACATNCAIDGADYAGTYGITSSGNALTLKFVTFAQQKNVGSRVYLMADDTHYQMFQLLNKEFTFDVDVSQLPCGINGALYFSEMDADGGLSRFSTNKAGAKYGTGYCDSQCPRDIKFINGVANSEGWVPSPSDPNAGTGNFGSCCGEMDIWEANSVSSAYTAHPCTVDGQTRCTGEDCAIQSRFDGVCDPDGCDFNSFRTGVTNFFGRGMAVDTSRKFTVVTQFLTNNNSTSGTLSEIRRVYVQDGRVIQNTKVNVPGMQPFDSITTDFCTSQKSVFGDTNSFQQHGGLANMSKALAKGMVLVLSIWDDHAAKMLWLDSDYPLGADASKPGVARGTCAQSTGDPNTVESQSPNAQVIFSNIRSGTIGSTFTGSAGSGGSPTTVPSGTTTTAPAAVQTKFGQCGGQGWTGPTACATGSSCMEQNPFFSQCL